MRHFDFTIWTKYHNSRHFNFAGVLRIKCFMCVSFKYFRNFGKSKKSGSKLKYICIFFCTPLIHESIKNIRKKSFFFEISSSLLSAGLQLNLQIPRFERFFLWKWVYKALCKKSSRFNLTYPRFRTIFSTALSIWVTKGF